jgi:hypothetical protein
MTHPIPKENCFHCQKSIKIGFPHFVCFGCNKIFHANCYKPSEAETINNNFFCIECKISVLKRYNPFNDMLDENELNGTDPYIQSISDILDKCKPYTCRDFNLETESFMSNLGGMIFQNIDGNKTNFDAFSMELERLNFKFQIIGLAETNVEVEDSSVYQLNGYRSFYQEKHVCKSKGTGVALYITNKLNAAYQRGTILGN